MFSKRSLKASQSNRSHPSFSLANPPSSFSIRHRFYRGKRPDLQEARYFDKNLFTAPLVRASVLTLFGCCPWYIAAWHHSWLLSGATNSSPKKNFCILGPGLVNRHRSVNLNSLYVRNNHKKFPRVWPHPDGAGSQMRNVGHALFS